MNIDSTQQLSILLFGGIVKVTEKEYIGKVKTGKNKDQDRFRNVTKEVYIKGLGLTPQDRWKTAKEGIYQTNEKIIGVIAKANKGDASEICKLILKIRGLSKAISTYYNSTEELTYDCDNCVHQQYVQVFLPTGRLSCTGINAQNQPKPPSKVTQHFVSRYDNGCITIVDYRALEPRVEAENSQDPQLIDDVNNDRDPHCKHLALAEHKSYDEVVELVKSSSVWDSKRSKIKGFTFSNQYLASNYTMSQNSGLSIIEIEQIVEARKLEYPKLYQWHENNEKEVEAKGFYRNMLGREFYFKKYPGKYHYQKPSYSKNEISNYKSQGTGWDVAGIMIGRFWRE